MTEFQIGDIVYVPGESVTAVWNGSSRCDDVHGMIVGIDDGTVVIHVFHGNNAWRCPAHLVSLTYRKSPMEDAALEYEEIMKMDELLGQNP